MGTFYITDGTYLVSHGCAADGTEASHAKAGQEAILGAPPGFSNEPTPYSGARWSIAGRCWCDTRTKEQLEAHAVSDVQAARFTAYPPLVDLADALYWQRQGDPTKLDAYMAAVAAVKEAIPKLA